MTPTRLDELLERYIDRRLDAAEKAELETLLRRSPEARREFWDRLQFEGALEETVSARRVSEWMTESERQTVREMETRHERAPVRERSRPVLTVRRSLLAACGLFGAAAVFLGYFSPQAPLLPAAETTHAGIAILATAWNVDWADQTPLAPGTVLQPGRLRLNAGVVGIEFYSGVRMTLAGPADIELTKIDEALCHFGRLRVQVPEVTRGFRVLTDRADVLDLGSEFGLEAAPNAHTEVHVFAGKVAWQNRSRSGAAGPGQHLAAGEAVRLEGDRHSTLAAQPARFMSRGELEDVVRASLDGRQKAWQLVSERLRRDSRALLYFDFDQEFIHSGSVTNLAPDANHSSDGIVVGCAQTQGRWPGRRGLEFKRPGDRVRVFIPGEFDKLTYIVWARVDRLKTDHAGLFLTDGFEPGETHWQIYNGRVRLGIGGGTGLPKPQQIAPDVLAARYGVNYESPPLFADAEEGAWCQIAVTVDSITGVVSHYYNGRRVSHATLVYRQKLRIGSAELGNWGIPASTDRQPVRNFDGRIDEFIILQDALTEAEIGALYEQGHAGAGA